jgi:undecaprenyl-diphosphatase
MNFIEVFWLSLVEGVTEFLPVSSTGHLILLSSFFGIQEEGFVKAFNIIIQFGAILAVVALYWRRFLPFRWQFYKKLVIAVLPAVVIGFLFKNKIDDLLESSTIVAVTFILGGFVLIWSDYKFKEDHENKLQIDDLNWKQCLIVGFAQCLAMIPGTSRSGASIIGGLALGLSRKAAAEFSFFLAVPTLAGAALLKTLKIAKTIDSSQFQFLGLGLLLSFVFALIAVKVLIQMISRYGYRHFGYYRIALGLVILYISLQKI